MAFYLFQKNKLIPTCIIGLLISTLSHFSYAKYDNSGGYQAYFKKTSAPEIHANQTTELETNQVISNLSSDKKASKIEDSEIKNEYLE